VSLRHVFRPRLAAPLAAIGPEKPNLRATTMTIERPMFPPRAASVDSFPLQPAIGQPDSQTLTSDSPMATPEDFDPLVDANGRVWFKARA
jgi:hypothetical protein